MTLDFRISFQLTQQYSDPIYSSNVSSDATHLGVAIVASRT